ncbi:MAG: methylglyoxal synthase [Clostridia bacterium]|nr:methylglyoxal synthase [Clostridia bacterium]
MEIAIIAHDLKKELMAQFCIAYCGVLANHHICATASTAQYISEATGLHIDRLMSGEHGGEQQIASRVAFNEIDILLYFRAPNPTPKTMAIENELLLTCDRLNIPVATNLATAETIITALGRGDLDWRENINPRSEYNRRKRR